MFNAGMVDNLDFDFSGIFEGGVAGVVPEPSTEMISAYQLAISNLMDDGDERIQAIVKNLDADGDALTDEQKLTETEKNAEIEKLNAEIWDKRKDLLADLCQQTPPVDQIKQLPHRYFLKFEEYVMGKWTPQAESAATTS